MTAMDDEARLIATLVHLREPFERKLIAKLPATAKRPALDYVNHAVVTDRLNRYAPGWSYDVEPMIVQGADNLPHVIAVFGAMTIWGVSRQEVGAVDQPSAYGQELKEAISDFIRRGAMRFGVAIDLWSKQDLTQPAASAPVVATASGAQAGGVNSSTSGAAERPEPVEGEDTGSGETSPTEHGSPVPARGSSVGDDVEPTGVTAQTASPSAPDPNGKVSDDTLFQLLNVYGTPGKAVAAGRRVLSVAVALPGEFSEAQALELIAAKVAA